MNLDEILAELELELEWRESELRLLKNRLPDFSKVEEQRRYRKALVVMLYSHFEGFCKVALSIYAKAINEQKFDCGYVNDSIAAAALADVFKALENPNKKCDLFRSTLPDDSSLHRFARQVDLVGNIRELWSRTAQIPVDDVVDTESNLSYYVIQKILYRLGLPHEAFKDFSGTIGRLIHYRHNLAHGKFMEGLDHDEYQPLEDLVLTMMREIKGIVWKFLYEEQFKRAS